MLFNSFEKSFEKIRIICRAMVVTVALVICVLGFGVEARAAIATGTSGECSWEIDDDGVLRIYPTNGISGTLANPPARPDLDNTYWYINRSNVQKVVVMPGVKTNTDCNNLFYDMQNCIEMDIANLDTSNAVKM